MAAQSPPESISRLRTAARVALLVGAAGSLGFLIHASQGRNQRLLPVLIGIWVLSPFMALGLADAISKPWSGLARATLSRLTLAVALGALAAYGAYAVWPPQAQAAFPFVAIPLASWLIMAVVGAIAAFIAARRSRGGKPGRSER